MASPPASIPAQAGVRIPTWAACLALVIAVTAAYANSFSGALVLDDVVTITRNPSIKVPWSWARALSPPEDSTLGGRPLANLTFALDQAVHGGTLGGYHATNLTIHVLSALTLFAVLRLTARSHSVLSAAGHPTEPLSNEWPLAAALLWAVHPLLTNAVTYISQRTEALMGLCYLLALLGFILGTRANSRGWLAASVAACAAGMAVKEVMVTAPLAILLNDRTFVAGSFAAAWRERRGYYLTLAGTWIVLAALLSGGLAQRSVGYNSGIDWLVYARTECIAVLTYLRLSLWPQPLIFDYGPVFARSWMEAALPAAAILALLVGTVWALVRRPVIGFPAAWFFLTLAPTSSVVPVALQPIAENRTYLPLMAMVVLVVVSLFKLGSRFALVVCAGAAFALGAATAQRNRLFKDETQLLADTLEKRPQNPRAHFNYANFLVQSGQVAAAAEHYETALRITPDYPEAHSNYGNLLSMLDRPAEAMTHHDRAVTLRPREPLRRINRANTLLGLNRADEAFAEFERVLRLELPAGVAATTRFAYGTALLRGGRAGEARRQFELGLQQDPTHAGLLDGLAVTLAQSGELAGALDVWRRTLEIMPANVTYRENYASALLGAGQFDQAVVQFQEILRTAPERARAHFGCAVALLRLGRAVDAKPQIQEALRLQPVFPEAQQLSQRIDETLAKAAAP